MATFEDLLRETIRAELVGQSEALIQRVTMLEARIQGLLDRVEGIEGKLALIYAYEGLEQALEAKMAGMSMPDRVAFLRSITEQVS